MDVGIIMVTFIKLLRLLVVLHTGECVYGQLTLSAWKACSLVLCISRSYGAFIHTWVHLPLVALSVHAYTCVLLKL